jgi:hypothetical protein
LNGDLARRLEQSLQADHDRTRPSEARGELERLAREQLGVLRELVELLRTREPAAAVFSEPAYSG